MSALVYKTPVWCTFPPTPQRIHIHTHKHTCNNGAVVTTSGAFANAGGYTHNLCLTHSTTMSTFNKDFIVPTS